MLRHAIWIVSLGLMVGGCATDGGNMDSSGGSASTTGSASTAPDRAVTSNPTTSQSGAAASTPMTSSTATAEPPEAKQSRQTRIAAGVEEETLDTCIGRIPQNATEGQRLLAEQTCRRDFAVRR